MEKIGTTFQNLALQASRPASETAVQTVGQSGPLPKILNRLTDVDIPKSAWSSWHEFGRARCLRRALTSGERTALEARSRELAPVVAPYSPAQKDDVAIALLDMFSGYRSMRQTGDEVMALVDSTSRTLRDFSAWAIKSACLRISQNGVMRDGRYDKQWPPNDTEIIAEVRCEALLYANQHRSAVALLSAEVET